jgi:aryl-alcohol dehydrogenase-like predicted oxidoreductase
VEYAKLGSTGMDVSRICLGCMGFGDAERWIHKWVLDEENSRPIIQKALELGINFFDTANVYSIGGSEEILGRALRDFADRDEVVIATKLHGQMREGPNGQGLSRKAILSEIDHSLKRLGTDYIDLYQIHRWDYQTPIEETMEALHDVVKAGKARYIGASAMFAWQFQKALHVAEKHGWDTLCLDAGSPELDLPRRGARDAAALPRGEDRGDPVQPTRLRTTDTRLVLRKHAPVGNRSDRENQVRRDGRDRSTGHREGRRAGRQA